MRAFKRWLAGLIISGSGASAASDLVYIGTITASGDHGIYALRFDPATGSIAKPFLVSNVGTIFAFDPKMRFLYAIDWHDRSVTAFAIDSNSARLKFLNSQPTGGKGPVHIGVDPSGRMLIVANYGSCTVSAFPLEADGKVGARTALLEQSGPKGPGHVEQRVGEGPVDRQAQAHPHCVAFSPDGRFAFVCDLGLDRIFIYRLDPVRGGLIPNHPAFVTVAPGLGPRHCVFSHDARFLYVLNEMGGSVSVFGYDARAGALTPIDTVSTLPADASGLNGSAEIRLHPGGRWLYASNRDRNGNGRGSDSVAVFERNLSSGTLRLVAITPAGRRATSITLSPDGAWLLCANEYSNEIEAFRLDPATGKLTPNGTRAAVKGPVCVTFYNTTGN